MVGLHGLAAGHSCGLLGDVVGISDGLLRFKKGWFAPLLAVAQGELAFYTQAEATQTQAE